MQLITGSLRLTAAHCGSLIVQQAVAQLVACDRARPTAQLLRVDVSVSLLPQIKNQEVRLL